VSNFSAVRDSKPTISWQWQHFDVLTAREWHRLLALRASVFVVEQGCPYADPDHKDPQCWHLSGSVDKDVIATLRAVPPGVSYAESSIGRVVVAPQARGWQLGRELMQVGIAFNRHMWGQAIRISGQSYLESFYQSLGFVTVSAPYLEDDIPHVEMLLAAP